MRSRRQRRVAIMGATLLVAVTSACGENRNPRPASANDSNAAPSSTRSRAPQPPPTTAALLPPDTTGLPARGCGPAGPATLVTFEVTPDGTHPDCLIVRATQQLRVLNDTNGFGGRGVAVVVNFARYPARTVLPGQTTTFNEPFGSVYADGEHFLGISHDHPATEGAIMWLK